jgi:acyl-CoA synthetase (AMP-forming)/AMP-acid ligase II
LIGAVPVPVNRHWHWHGEELRHVLTHSGARAALAHSDLIPGVKAVRRAGVVLIEVPAPEELAAAYGGASVTRRHPGGVNIYPAEIEACLLELDGAGRDCSDTDSAGASRVRG